MSEQDNQVVEAINSSDDQDILIDLDEDTSEVTEDVTTLQEQLEKERTARQQLTARAKRVEAELRELKQQGSTTQTHISNQNLSADDVAATVLQANGMDTDLIDQLKALSKVRGYKSILEAQADPIFQAIKKTKEDEAKAKKSQLGASKGSPIAKKEKNINSGGLTKDEHKALWKELNNK